MQHIAQEFPFLQPESNPFSLRRKLLFHLFLTDFVSLFQGVAETEANEQEAKGWWQGPTEGASSPDVPRKLCGMSPPSSSCGGRAVPLGRDRPVHHSLAASLQEIWRWFPPDCHPQVSLRISADHVAFVVRSCLSREIPLMPSFCETGIYRGSLPRAALCRPAKASLSSERLHGPLTLPWNKT